MRYMWTAWTAYMREYVNIKTYALHLYILKIINTFIDIKVRECICQGFLEKQGQ